METFCDERIATCPTHGIRYNREEGGCADCTYDARRKPLPALRRWAGAEKFRCPFCGSKSIRKESCSRYWCGIKSGLYRRRILNRCRNCDSRTKYRGFCTYYACRRVAGTQSMYNRAARR